MVVEDVQVGELVRIRESGSRAVVREVDRRLLVVEVEILASGVCRWLLLDQIEPVVPWYERRRTQAW